MKVSRAQLQRVGGGGADGANWAARAGAAALAIGLLGWGFALVRPLPDVDAEAPPTAFAPPAGIPEPAPMDIRERRLAALTDTNLFAPDRAFWEIDAPQVVATDEPAEEAAEAEAAKPATQPSQAASANLEAGADAIDPFRNIELTDPKTLPSKSQAKVKEVQLRAVYSLDGRPRALISLASDPANPSGGSYGVGDTVDEEWSVLAIDALTDRVVLSREGQNFVFRLYDELPQIAASPSARPKRGVPVIERRTPAEVRRALLDSGLPASEVDELMALALEEEAAQPEPALEEPAMQGAPAGLEQIIDLMRSNPFEREADEPADDEPQDDDPQGAEAPSK